jgi:hypothetical protein
MISATNARSSISRASCPLRKKRKGGYLLLLALDDDKTRAAPVVKALVFACIAKADDMVVVVVVSSSSSSSFVEQSKNDADVYINKRGGEANWWHEDKESRGREASSSLSRHTLATHKKKRQRG